MFVHQQGQFDVAIVGVDSEQRLAFRISLDCGCSLLERNTFIVTTTIGYLGFMRESGGNGTDAINSRIKVSDEGNNKILRIRSVSLVYGA